MRRRRPRGLRALPAILAGSALILVGFQIPMRPAAAATVCDVEYTVQNDWGSGFTANVTINNLEDPVAEWTLEWDFSGDQQVTNLWNGDWSQDGSTVTVNSLSWNGSLGTGDSATVGFNGSYSGSNPAPTGFTLNGVPCGGQQPPGGDDVLEVDPTSVSVPEGETATFDVALSQQPDADVTVSVAKAGGDADISVQSGGSLDLTTDNWDTSQQVTLAAAQDEDEDFGSATFTVSADGYEPVTVTASEAEDDVVLTQYAERFVALYEDIKDPANGYFSDEGVPYHSVETLIVEAPDYGHETTSETFSYWLWLEAMYGRISGDWAPFNEAWTVMEEYMIPEQEEQPSNSGYDPSDPADYVGEFEDVTQYPAPIDPEVPVGQDPLAQELSSTYGTDTIYGMHWLLDTDDWYEYNEPCHPDGERDNGPTLINTFQRGAEESVWETVTHPSCETFEYGSDDGGGFLELFVDDDPAQQWRYTNAPDADARVVQVAYWAQTWAEEQGNAGAISESIANAAKMGDYLRYAMYDKYFKTPGCEGLDCPAGSGKDSAHYLMSWYYAWGGALQGNWAWRIGSSHNHFGYQNPVAAWALSEFEPLIPQSPTAQEDWATSLDRQLEFYTWLQSAEGAIAGGATNSWLGHYADRPADLPTFYGMTYDVAPVFHDPPSGEWFGWQAWSMERVAEYLFLTGDERAQQLLDEWVSWALSETTLNDDGTYAVPSTLEWSGAPDDWNPDNPGDNSNLHVSVVETTNDVGVTGSYAKALMYYAAATGDTEAQEVAKGLIDRMWTENRDDIGVSVPETRDDYDRFQQDLFIPEDWTGQMATGDEINSDSTFLSIRSKYTEDPSWPEVEEQLNGGEDATFNYHRFWAQVDVATALATYDQLFE